MNGSVDGGRSRVYQIRLDDQIIVRHPVSLSCPSNSRAYQAAKSGILSLAGRKTFSSCYIRDSHLTVRELHVIPYS
jgi:hypothetical protein